MGCCSSLEPCCRRIGCSCKGKGSDTMASIEQNRSCTDMPFILVFLVFVIYMVSAIWGPAFNEGDPDLLIHGVDYRRRICGKSEGVKDKPYAFWPDYTSFRFKVCTDNCTKATQNSANHISPYTYQSDTYLDKYCLPSSDSGISISGFDDASNQIQRFIGDIETAMPIIGASFALAFVFSFLYVFLMKLCVGVLVWSAVALIVVGGVLTGYVFVQKANDSELSSSDSNARKAFGYLAFILTGIFVLVIIFARNRIRIAIQIIKSAGRALSDMPLIVLFPFWPLFLVIGFFFAWAFGSIYIFSAGSHTNKDTPSALVSLSFAAEGDGYQAQAQYLVINYNDTVRNAFAPHFFLLLWVVQICVYFTFAVIAGAVADWYFTARDEASGKKKLSSRPVCKSVWRTLRFHIGTVLYAALLIALVQFVRYAIRYLERTMNGGKEPNRLQKVLFRVVDCLLWCLECCLDKISKNALIWMAIYGDPFCPSICGSFALIWANLMRVAVITFFSAIVTLLGKIMVPLLTVGVCGLILMNVDPYKSELESPIMPLLVILVVSFAVALLFLTVYDTAIDTIFLCFLLDEKHNKDKGTMLADQGLRSIVQKFEAESKELASTVQRNSNYNTSNAVVVDNKEVDDSTTI